MTDENTKRSKLSWSKTLIKKWFTTNTEARDLGANYDACQDFKQECSNSFTKKAETTITKSKQERSKRNSNSVRKSNFDLEGTQATDVNSYRIFTATWNVAGKPPPNSLDIEDMLHASPPADFYVLGFQEVVPLNAGNVLGTEDNIPARRWLALIQKTLNNLPSSPNNSHPSTVCNPVIELVSDLEAKITQKASSLFSRHSFQSFSRSMRIIENDLPSSQPRLERGFSVRDHVMSKRRRSNYGPIFKGCLFEDENEDYLSTADQELTLSYNKSFQGRSKYCLIGSKQMVGVFHTVWIKRDLRKHVRSVRVSCVERGLMGYLGNKGSISISMFLHQTSFCFVCSHLTSGQKEGDELRRNLDVIETLKKTRFSKVRGIKDQNSPRTILDHDRIIWLGDLNYRIALTECSAKALVQMCNWRALLEYDQLRMEQRRGRVFKGWHEGKINFRPTYKYLNNSDRYAGDDMIPRDKRRTPAWCDRILWHGKGLDQLCYLRGESKFSDHRPVYSVFLAEVESIDSNWAKKSMCCMSSRIEVEEMLPYSFVQKNCERISNKFT